ncbi:nucleoid occlusion protein [Rhodocyclaceae bacterium]
MEKTTRTKKTVSHAKPKVMPPQVISEVHLIDIERIEVRHQVRKFFDLESIEELASDIEQNGLLQPVIVSPVGDEKYRLVCGERRLRAIVSLKQKAIPALITKMDERTIIITQIAENIQRENMTLWDTAAALDSLMVELVSVDAVAGQIKKSKAWVSKRLAVMKYGTAARNLMKDGITDDVEILGVLDNIEKNHGMGKAMRLEAAIREGMSREEVRDFKKEADDKGSESGTEKERATGMDTQEKASAIRNELNGQSLDGIALLLAAITSPKKDEREKAKAFIKGMTKGTAEDEFRLEN